MALQNNPNLYTGGNVVLNQLPHTELYAQLMARKQARNDAFDQYLQNLNKNVNPAGMRNQEAQVFNDKLNQWQQFGMQHRDEIQNRKNGADIQFQRGYQDLQNLIARSKTVEAGKKPLIPMLIDPDKRDRLGDGVIEDIHAQDQPLYVKDKNGQWVDNPDFKPLDYNNLNFNPKPFDQDKYIKGFSDLKRMQMPPVVTLDPTTKTQTETTRSVFDPEAKNIIALRAAHQVATDKDFEKNIIGKLNPADYNDFYKQNYGHDIQTPADLAAAYTLKNLQQNVVTSKVAPDTFDRQKEMENIRYNNALKLTNYRHALSEGDKDKAGLWIDDYLNGLVNSATNEGEYKNAAGQTVREKDIPLDATLSKALTKNGKAPDALRVTADGQFRPIYFEKGNDKQDLETYGKSIGKNGSFVVDKILSVPISSDQLKLALGKTAGGVKQTNKEMSMPSKPKHPLPAGKPRTVKQGNYTYTWNEQNGAYE